MIIILLLLPLLTGCPVVLVGAGAGAGAPGRKVCGKEAWPVASGGRYSEPRCPHPDNTPRAASAVTATRVRVTRMVFDHENIDRL